MALSSVLSYFTIFSLFYRCLLTISAQTYSNITLGSSITAGALSVSWLSPSKDFAFGFQEIEPGGFLLAIWFNKIHEKTITWSANRDHLAPKGSKLQLTADRSLILIDSINTNGDALAFAAMLNNGNFVLVSRASAVIWQSFDEPTNTLLPTQALTQGSRLIASSLSNNYSSGRFSFNLDYNGNLGLYTTDYPLFSTLNTNYQMFDNQGLGYQVIFSQSGSLYNADSHDRVLAHIFPNEVSHGQNLYQKVILEYDGVLRHSPTRGWSIKSFTPENICTAVIEQTGSGVCGFNSYCKLGDDMPTWLRAIRS